MVDRYALDLIASRPLTRSTLTRTCGGAPAARPAQPLDRSAMPSWARLSRRSSRRHQILGEASPYDVSVPRMLTRASTTAARRRVTAKTSAASTATTPGPNPAVSLRGRRRADVRGGDRSRPPEEQPAEAVAESCRPMRPATSRGDPARGVPPRAPRGDRRLDQRCLTRPAQRVQADRCAAHPHACCAGETAGHEPAPSARPARMGVRARWRVARRGVVPRADRAATGKPVSDRDLRGARSLHVSASKFRRGLKCAAPHWNAFRVGDVSAGACPTRTHLRWMARLIHWVCHSMVDLRAYGPPAWAAQRLQRHGREESR